METLSVDREFSAPGAHLCGLAWDGRNLWYSDGDTNLLYRLDPNTGTVLARIACPDVRTDLAYDGRNLWQVAGRPKRIRVIDPIRGGVLREVDLDLDREHACGLCVSKETTALFRPEILGTQVLT